MAAETQHETNKAPGKIADRGEFDSGMHFCVEPGEFKIGTHIIERLKLPLNERQLFEGDDSRSAAEKPFAEDKTVVVSGVEGTKLSVADLFREGDELISGASRDYLLSAEGWIVPKALSAAETLNSVAIEELIRGYFLPFDGLEDDALAEVEQRALVLAKPREEIRMAPGYVEQQQA